MQKTKITKTIWIVQSLWFPAVHKLFTNINHTSVPQRSLPSVRTKIGPGEPGREAERPGVIAGRVGSNFAIELAGTRRYR